MQYLSKHSCIEDPGGIIGESVSMGNDFPGPAQDIFLAWALQLTKEQNTALCAQTLLQKYPILLQQDIAAPLGMLAQFLIQASQSTAPTTKRKRNRRQASNKLSQ